GREDRGLAGAPGAALAALRGGPARGEEAALGAPGACPARHLRRARAGQSMTAVVFYFQCHQPNRLNRFRYEDVGRASARPYFDDELNKLIVERVAERCYLPMNEVLAAAIADTGGRFRCSFAITGTLLTQLERWAPRALDSFVALARTGAVEFVCETGFHSLASVGEPVPGDLDEFAAQVEEQRKRLRG